MRRSELADAGTIAWILSLRGLKQKAFDTEATEEREENVKGWSMDSLNAMAG